MADFQWDTFFEPIQTDRPTVPFYNDAMCFEANPGFRRDHRECLFNLMTSQLVSQRSVMEQDKHKAIMEHDEKYKLTFMIDSPTKKKQSLTQSQSDYSKCKEEPGSKKMKWNLLDECEIIESKIKDSDFDTEFIKAKYRRVAGGSDPVGKDTGEDESKDPLVAQPTSERFDDARNSNNIKVVGPAAIKHATKFVNARTVINAKRSDQEMSAAMWTLDQLKSYIPAEMVKTTSPFVGNPDALDSKSRKFIRHEIIEQSKILLPEQFHFSKSKMHMDKLWLKMERIPDMVKTLSEAEVRTFLDIVFHRICITNGIQMRLEHVIGRLQTKSLPIAKTDYLFLKDGVCFGLAEAKAPFRLTSDSIPQFIIEILRIQARYENPDLSFFGILTDFRRFVFLELKGKNLTFEHSTGAFVRGKRLHVHTISTWDDLFKVADIMNQLAVRHARVLNDCLKFNKTPVKASPSKCNVSKSPKQFFRSPVVSLRTSPRLSPKKSSEVICLD